MCHVKAPIQLAWPELDHRRWCKVQLHLIKGDTAKSTLLLPLASCPCDSLFSKFKKSDDINVPKTPLTKSSDKAHPEKSEGLGFPLSFVLQLPTRHMYTYTLCIQKH